MELVKQIEEIFEHTPSDLAKIESLLSVRKFSKEEIAEIAIDFTDDCFYEYRDALNPEVKSVTLENMHSNYILEAIKLLIKFGLDPNTIIDNKTVLWNTSWIDAPDVAASVMKLLLENGADPNQLIPGDDETLFDSIDFKVSYDEYSHEYFFTVQCWLILMAFGACWQDGKIPIRMLNGNSVEIFKEFQLYDYEIEPLPQEPGKFGCWIMHIYNVETKEEVAVYR